MAGQTTDEMARALRGIASANRESQGSPLPGPRPGSDRDAPSDSVQIFQSKGFAGGVPIKHRKIHRETVGWHLIRCQAVFVSFSSQRLRGR